MRTETVENVAGTLAGIAAAAFFTVMFVLMSAPVVETVRKFIS